MAGWLGFSNPEQMIIAEAKDAKSYTEYEVLINGSFNDMVE